MKAFKYLLIVLIIFLSLAVKAQIINYSEPDKNDFKTLDYEIIGKLNGIVHIYKSYRDKHTISLFDANMQTIDKINLDFLPERIINVDFLLYPSYYYLLYQYQKKSIVYCMAVKFDDKGKKMGEPLQLDTTSISFNTNSKIYTVIYSEDKKNIMLVKINRPNEKINQVTTILFNSELQQIKHTQLTIQMQERYATLSEFQLDNKGDVAFIKAYGSGQSDIVNKIALVTKAALEDKINTYDINLKGIYLDDIRLKIDNYNNHYLITSFYTKQRRGNIDGFFCYLWDNNTSKEYLNTNLTFSDDFREDAKNNGSLKEALNDYYLRNIVIKKDGGFLLAAESVFTSNTSNDIYNRWDGFGTPYSGFNNYSVYGMGGMYNNPFARSFNNVTRYYAQNIIMLSVDTNGKLNWSNVIRKTQQDDNADNFISYSTLNSGDKVHFIFNIQEQRENIITDQSITPDGQIIRNPTLRRLDNGYDFMPRLGKQTGIRQIVIPCLYKNYICFAKIDF